MRVNIRQTTKVFKNVSNPRLKGNLTYTESFELSYSDCSAIQRGVQLSLVLHVFVSSFAISSYGN
jgi:hypothetical protein